MRQKRVQDLDRQQITGQPAPPNGLVGLIMSDRTLVRVFSAVVDFLIYGRAAPSAVDHTDTPRLDDAHWAYMDGFADQMTVRGPTLSEDRQTWTGSLHVVDLPDARAARAFATHDPYDRAGLFAEHQIWRFENLLGRAMWEFTPPDDDVPFLIIAESESDDSSSDYAQAVLASPLAERFIAWGKLRPVTAGQSSGVALVLSAPDRDAVQSLIADERAILDGHTHVEIHAWEFGGRR